MRGGGDNPFSPILRSLYLLKTTVLLHDNGPSGSSIKDPHAIELLNESDVKVFLSEPSILHLPILSTRILSLSLPDIGGQTTPGIVPLLPTRAYYYESYRWRAPPEFVQSCKGGPFLINIKDRRKGGYYWP